MEGRRRVIQLPCFCVQCYEDRILFWSRKKAQRRQWHPTPVLLPGKSHGGRSLICCSPWGREESDTTERLHFHFSLSCIGEGNDNPLQCSCLENPRDRGAWLEAIYGVSQSRTRLKRLSSSSRKKACGVLGCPKWNIENYLENKIINIWGKMGQIQIKSWKQ